MGAAAIPIMIAVAAAGTAYQIKSNEDAKKDQKSERDKAEQRQAAQAAAAEEKLRTEPRKSQGQETPQETAQDRARKLRAGLSSTIKTSPVGLSGAPGLSIPTLAAGYKTRLGQ